MQYVLVIKEIITFKSLLYSTKDIYDNASISSIKVYLYFINIALVVFELFNLLFHHFI